MILQTKFSVSAEIVELTVNMYLSLLFMLFVCLCVLYFVSCVSLRAFVFFCLCVCLMFVFVICAVRLCLFLFPPPCCLLRVFVFVFVCCLIICLFFCVLHVCVFCLCWVRAPLFKHVFVFSILQ